MDRLFGTYALLAGAALAFPGRPALWPLLGAVHLLGALLAFGIGPARRLTDAAGRRWPRAHDWYPLLVIPAVYKELGTLILSTHGGHFYDPWIIAIEEVVFRGQPSRLLSQLAPGILLSELLHAGYLAYYPIIYLPPILLYATGRKGDFRRLLFPLMLSFYAHYLIFIYFPVQGPRYLFPPPGGTLADGPLYALTHRLLEAGSSQGAAFPSSHVGVSVVATLLVRRFLPRWFAAFVVATTLLALGAVYGGFHYATDVILGAVYGVVIAWAAPAVRRVFAGRADPLP
jgi:membrane-associated phospholipid phosphatase